MLVDWIVHATACEVGKRKKRNAHQEKVVSENVGLEELASHTGATGLTSGAKAV